MKLFILATLSAFACLTVTAQKQKNKADSVYVGKKVNYETVDTVIENRLVALALKGPNYRASNHQNAINELELKKTKNAWLNLLAVSYSVNDQSFNKNNTPTNTIVYPKYNFGVTVPLGIIFSQGTQVKSAREAIAFSKDQQEELARTIKAQILAKYKEFKLYRSLIQIQSELINDVLANATQAEENFKKGTITVELYIATQKTKNDELAKNLNLKLQQDLIQIDIERMIGVPLETVLETGPSN